MYRDDLYFISIFIIRYSHCSYLSCIIQFLYRYVIGCDDIVITFFCLLTYLFWHAIRNVSKFHPQLGVPPLQLCPASMTELLICLHFFATVGDLVVFMPLFITASVAARTDGSGPAIHQVL